MKLMTKEKNNDITKQLESDAILPLIFRLILPAVAAQLIMFLYNIVDRM